MTGNSRKLKGQAEKTSIPSYRILIDGEELNNKYSIFSILVYKAVNKIPVAQLALLDGNLSKQDFEASSSNILDPGKEVTIKLGYSQKEEVVFKGIITKHGIKVKDGQPMMLVIELKDKAVKMTIHRKNKYYEEKKDSEIIDEILKEYDVKSDVESTEVTHKEMVQYYCTDWDFIVARAEATGQLVFVSDGEITVKKPDLSNETLGELAFGHNIYEFEAEMDARDEYAEVKTSAWDYAKQELIEKTSKPPAGKEQGELTGEKLSDVIGAPEFPMQHTGKRPVEELQAWADAKLMRSRLAKIKGRVKIEGYNVVKPGDMIALQEFSKKFNGNAFVSEIRHQFSSSSTWYTDIKFGLSQEFITKKYPDVTEVPASGMIPGIHGLHIGIVTNIHEDPDGEDRVKVKIPVISTEDEGTWARIATLDAGKERGSFFRPEVNDEVIVGFLNDDPRDPIILGMLHSSALKSPIAPSEENNEKGFVTRSKIKLVFDDDKKSVTIETPGKNMVVISDDEKSITLTDQNKNKIVMDDKGITIESSKDIMLFASKGDIKAEGVNISNSANSKFTAEGTSGAELTSSANAVIKGAVVQIN
jgi:Rhs element Vgr protein